MQHPEILRPDYTTGIQYKWIGGSIDNRWNPTKGTFSNMYYKFLNGKMYHDVRSGDDNNVFKTGEGYTFFVGDKNGNAVSGTGFALSCSAMWNNTNNRPTSAYLDNHLASSLQNLGSQSGFENF